MATVRVWTGRDARVLREALRLSLRDFASHLGVGQRTVSNWEARGVELQPRPEMQAILDTTLARASAEVQERFRLATLQDGAVDRQRGADRSISPAAVCPADLETPEERDDMNRRELLRLVTMAGTVAATSDMDWDRLDSVSGGKIRLDPTTVDEYAVLNSHLWRVFALSKTKSITFPLVREQLDVLFDALQRAHTSALHQRLCELTGELFQLAGEIHFDGNQYTDAAHCYTLAATVSKEAGAFDLWACALTRHSFLGIYERQFAKAAALLGLAAKLASRGDGSLSTRYWVSAVQAEAFAGLGDSDACQRALDRADHVHRLGQVHNSGWLRFDGSRLAEERGTCYVALNRPGPAEVALTDALNARLSERRRGSVLTDFAMLGVQRRDLDQVVAYASAALDSARHTGSGVTGRKLHHLRVQLEPFHGNGLIQQLDQEITALTATTVS